MKRLCLSLRGQGKWALLSAIALGLIASPLTLADDGDVMKVGAGNSADTKETNISGQKVKTFATRQSNNLEGDGGSATYGCRSSFANEPCLQAFALRTARAFEFRSRGNEGGLITVEGDKDPRKNRPFSTNATGVATGLNADEVDNLDASEIIAAARAKLGLDADTLDGKDSTDFLLTTGKAADADKLDGKDSTDFLTGNVYKRESAVGPGTLLGDGTNVIAQACDPGDVLLSGGPANVSANTDLLESFPTPGSTNSWSARINDNAVADNFSVVVLCIDR